MKKTCQKSSENKKNMPEFLTIKEYCCATFGIKSSVRVKNGKSDKNEKKIVKVNQ
jgi:hypothetical protein